MTDLPQFFTRSPRHLFFTGKGGVGKTSLACASAVLLADAGRRVLLLTVEQEGRFQRYRANLPLMLDLVTYLTEECCAGHPEQCAVPARVKAVVSRRSSAAKRD